MQRPLNGTRYNAINMLGAITDIVKIGGQNYSVDAILDKIVTAKVSTKIYSRPGGNVVGTVAAGQAFGKVFSYLKPNSVLVPDGRTWLQFENANSYFFVPDEAVSPTVLKQQGVQTLEEQVQAEADEKLKQENPLEYYISKYAGKVLLTIGGIYLVAELGKAVIKKKL